LYDYRDGNSPYRVKFRVPVRSGVGNGYHRKSDAQQPGPNQATFFGGCSILLRMQNQFDYDVALSFAGGDRYFVAPVAEILKSRGVHVFFDEYERGNLWGKDLYSHLADVYSKRARYCVMFLSQHFARKAWTNHERKNAQARAFNENHEYILPVRLDDTEIPGIPATVGYVDHRSSSAEQIVDLILEKLDHSLRSNVSLTHSAPLQTGFNIPIPKIRKTFTQREKDKFGQDCFAFIMRYFETALKRLEASDPDIESDFLPVHLFKFACKVYVRGEVANQCKIWLGGWAGGAGDQINYSAGRHIDLNNDNSINDMLTIVEDGHQLRLELGGLGFASVRPEEQTGTKESAAEYLWRRFVQQLEN